MYTGISKINDSVYIDIAEVDVHAWLSYYTWKLNYEGQTAANKVLPDKNAIDPEIWEYINSKSNYFSGFESSLTNQPLGNFEIKCDNLAKRNKNLYYSSLANCPFLITPITGVSYEQVVDFCEWRTKIIGAGVIIFRLPSNAEWTNIVKAGLSDEERKSGDRDSIISTDNRCRLFNYKVTNPCKEMVETGYSQSKLQVIASNEPDKNKIYDTFGNVSEMVSEKGMSKGGNYLVYANQCHPDSVQYYSKPEKWLGFRCIAIKKNK
jgi:hypothetical protein